MIRGAISGALKCCKPLSTSARRPSEESFSSKSRNTGTAAFTFRSARAAASVVRSAAGKVASPSMRKAAGAASLIFSRKARLMRTAFVGCSERQLRDPFVAEDRDRVPRSLREAPLPSRASAGLWLPLWGPDPAIGCRSSELAPTTAGHVVREPAGVFSLLQGVGKTISPLGRETSGPTWQQCVS